MVPNSKEHRIPVVYLITNKVNGKIYVGSAKNCYRRYYNYHRIPQEKCIAKRTIDHAIKKYGFDQFDFEILERVNELNELIKREQYYLDTLQPFGKKGYNTCRVAGSTLGVKYSKESCQRISAALKGKSSKPVLQIDPVSLKVIAEYSSIQEAAQAIGLGGTVVSNVVRGKKVTAGGFLWCFKSMYDAATFQPRRVKQRGGPIGKPTRPVMQLTSEGQEIRIWDHAALAAAELNCHPDCIRHACYGSIKIARGYKWKFATDQSVIDEVNSRLRREWKEKHGLTID